MRIHPYISKLSVTTSTIEQKKNKNKAGEQKTREDKHIKGIQLSLEQTS